MELAFNVSEMLGMALRTHAVVFLPIYRADWHELVSNMAHKHCLMEDRHFAFYVVSDVIEFGLVGLGDIAVTTEYFAQVIPLLLDGLSAPQPQIRQVCAYAIGIAAESAPTVFMPYAKAGLLSLAASISMGEAPAEPRGYEKNCAVFRNL